MVKWVTHHSPLSSPSLYFRWHVFIFRKTPLTFGDCQPTVSAKQTITNC